MKFQFWAALASWAHGNADFCQDTDIDPVHMLPGEDVQKVYLDFTGTAEDCQQECANLHGCDAFTFYDPNDICRLSSFALMARYGKTYDQVFVSGARYKGKVFGLKSGAASCVKKEPWKPLKVRMINYGTTTRDMVTWFQAMPLPKKRNRNPGCKGFVGIKSACEGLLLCGKSSWNWPDCDQTIAHVRPDVLSAVLAIMAMTYLGNMYVCRIFVDLLETNAGALPLEYTEVKMFGLMLFINLWLGLSNYSLWINGPPVYFPVVYTGLGIRQFLSNYPIIQLVLIETRKTWKTFNDFEPIGYLEWFFYFCLAVLNLVLGFLFICTQFKLPGGFNIGGAPVADPGNSAWQLTPGSKADMLGPLAPGTGEASWFNIHGTYANPMLYALNYEARQAGTPETSFSSYGAYGTYGERISWVGFTSYWSHLLVFVIVVYTSLFLIYAVYRNRDFWKIAQNYISWLIGMLIFNPYRLDFMWTGYYTKLAKYTMLGYFDLNYDFQFLSHRGYNASQIFDLTSRALYAMWNYTFLAMICSSLMNHLGLVTGQKKYWYSPDFGQRVKNYFIDTKYDILFSIYALFTIMIPNFHVPGLFWENPDIKVYVTVVLFIGMLGFAFFYLQQEQTKCDYNDWAVAGLARLGERCEMSPGSMQILLRAKFMLFWGLMLVSDNLLFLAGVFGGKVKWGNGIDLGFDLFNQLTLSMENTAFLSGGSAGIVNLRTEFFMTICVIYGFNTVRLYIAACTEPPAIIFKFKSTRRIYNIYLEISDFSTIFLYVIMLFSSFRVMLRGFRCVDDINNPGIGQKATWAFNYKCMKESGDEFYPKITNHERFVVHTGFFVSFWFILFTSFRIVAARQKIKLPELTQDHFFIIYQTLSRLLLVMSAELLESSPAAIIIIGSLLVIGHAVMSFRVDVVIGFPGATAFYFAIYCAQSLIHLVALINLGGLQGDSEDKKSAQDAAFLAAWIVAAIAGCAAFFLRYKKDSNKIIVDRVQVISNVQWETGAIEPVNEIEEEKERTSKAEATSGLVPSGEDEQEDLVLLPRDLSLWDIGAAIHTQGCYQFLKNALDFESVISETQDPAMLAMALEGTAITSLTEETVLRGLRIMRRALRCDTGRVAVHFKKSLIFFPTQFLRQKSLQMEAMIVLERISRDRTNITHMRLGCYTEIIRAWAQDSDPVFHALAGMVLNRIGKGKKVILYNNRKDDSAPNYTSEALEKLNDDLVSFMMGGTVLTFVPIYPSIMGGKHVSLWHPRGETDDVTATHGGYNSSIHKFSSNDTIVDTLLIFPPYNFLPPNMCGGALEEVKACAIVGGRTNAAYLPSLMKEQGEASGFDAMNSNPLFNNIIMQQIIFTVQLIFAPLANLFFVLSPPKDATNAQPDEPYEGFNEHWDKELRKAMNKEAFVDAVRPSVKNLYLLYFEEGPNGEAGDVQVEQNKTKKTGTDYEVNETIAELESQKPAGTKMLGPQRTMVMSSKFMLLFRGKITPFRQTTLFRSLDSARVSAVAAENFGQYKDQSKFKSALEHDLSVKRKSSEIMVGTTKANRV